MEYQSYYASVVLHVRFGGRLPVMRVSIVRSGSGGRRGASADPAQERKNSKQFLESESGSIISITTMGTQQRWEPRPRLGFKLGRAHAVFKWRCGAISGTLCRVIHGAASSLADLWCKRVHAPVSGPTSRPTALQLPLDKCHPSAWLQLRLLRGLQVEPAPVTQFPAPCAVATLFLLHASYCTRLMHAAKEAAALT